MRVLSATTETAVDRPHVEPVLLVQIHFTSPSDQHVYLCSRPFGTANVFNSQYYEPIIMEWSTIYSGRTDPITLVNEPGDFTLTVLNTIPVYGYDNFSKLIDAFDWAFAKVTALTIYDGGVAVDGDEITVFEGQLEAPEVMTQERVELKVSGRELGLKDKYPVNYVSTTDWANADPDDVGKMIPHVIGQCKRVPAVALIAGWKTSIVEDMTDSSPGNAGTLEVTDASGFPSGGTDFTIQIDAEQVRIDSYSGNTLTLVGAGARAYGGTTATDHDAGSDCMEVLSHYVYAVSDHMVQSIDAVYVDGIRQEITNGSNSDCRVYYGDLDDSFPFVSQKGIIDFQTLPSVTKQVNLDVSHDDTVADFIGVSDTIDFTVPGSSKEVIPTGASGANWTNHSRTYDGNDQNYAQTTTQYSVITITFPSTSYGTITTQYAWVKLSFGSFSLSGWTPANISTGGTGWYRFSRSGGSWNTSIVITNNDVGTRQVFEAYKIIEYTSDATKSGSASKTGSAVGAGTASLTGNSSADTVIGGKVTADVSGIYDGSGLFTRNRSALIEDPHHVFYYLTMKLLNAEAGLVGYWPFNEGTGTVAGDASGREYHGKLEGTPAAYVLGKYGSALHFDGAADYVNCGICAECDFTEEDFTVAFWINPDTQTTIHRIVSRGKHNDDGWEILMSSTGRILLRTNQNGAYQESNSGAISTSAWTHVAVIRQGEDADFYINGVLSNNSIATHIDPEPAMWDLKFGTYTPSHAYWFDGKLDEVRIYKRAITLNEITGLISNAQGTIQQSVDIEDGLMAYYRMNEDPSGAVTYDARGQGDLIAFNSPTSEAGIVDNCYHFDGSTEYCAGAGTLDHEFTYHNFSVSFWFKMDGVPPAAEIMIGNYWASNTGWGLYMNKTPRLCFITAQSGATQSTVSNTLSADTWYHAVVTRSGASATIYIDGADDTLTYGTHIDPVVSGEFFTLARYAQASSNFFDGSLDEIRVYDRVLTTDEISALYNNPKGSTYSQSGYKLHEEMDLAICLTEKPVMNELFNELALQCRSMQFWEAGKHCLVYQDDDPTHDGTVTGHRLTLNSVVLSKTVRAEVANYVVGVYDKHYDDSSIEGLRAEVFSDDASSINKYGKISFEWTMDYVTGSTHAQASNDHIKDLRKEPLLLVEMQAHPAYLKYKRGDVLRFDITEANLNNALLDFVEAADEFRVLETGTEGAFTQSMRLKKV